jgi:DNA-binding transcriptional LysR family regulator
MRTTANLVSLIYAERMLDLWALRVLVAVADNGSFSGASEPLRLTQPAVSRQVASLERRLGVSLFHRLPRGVRPTHAGEIAIEQARAILGRVSGLETELKALTDLTSGRVRMSAFASANTSLVPEAILRFTRAYPGIDVSLADVPSPRAVDAVASGDVDLGVVTDWDLPRAIPDGVDVLPLTEDELFVALPGDHRLAARDAVRLRDLSELKWIEGAHPDCLGPLEALDRGIGSPPDIGYTCDDWNGKLALVAAGLGVMVYPSMAVASLRDDVVLRRPTPALPARGVHVVVTEQRYRPAAVTEMTKLLVAVAGETRDVESPSP